jgi:hypothetical protein
MMEHAMTQRKPSIVSRGRPAPLALTHPNAAGIDIGSASHFVAVPPDRDDEPVREFRSFTGELERLADWLAQCGVDTVAMESTGVYWIALFELLDARGFTVLLVNARHVKNVSGRKSDVLDCQWIQQLMTYGLLSGAFRPADQVCVLRSLWRQRECDQPIRWFGDQAWRWSLNAGPAVFGETFFSIAVGHHMHERERRQVFCLAALVIET